MKIFLEFAEGLWCEEAAGAAEVAARSSGQTAVQSQVLHSRLLAAGPYGRASILALSFCI
jgi:hypothetical protein